MKISVEVKVGLIGIMALVVLIWGINYLKGRNILSSSYTLYAFYPESGGLESSAPVLMNGVKIGYVDRVILRPEKDPPIETILSIEKAYTLPKGTLAELFSSDLIGTKAIRVVPPASGEPVSDMDTLEAGVAADLVTTLQSRLYPVVDQIGSLASSMETLLERIDSLLAMNALPAALTNLEGISRSLNDAVTEGGSLHTSFGNLESFTTMLEDQKEELAAMIGHLNSITASVDSAGIGRLAGELNRMAGQFSLLLEQVNSGTGSAGQFFYSDSLYDRLTLLITDLDILIRDLNENPEDYVQISVFGRYRKKD